jgi:amino-acid N-acetyltransferase
MAQAPDARPEMDFTMVDDDRIKPYRFAIVGHESVETPAGRFDTVRVERIDSAGRRRGQAAHGARPVTPAPASAADLPPLRALLRGRGLPDQDLTPAHLAHFLVLRDGAALGGAIGVEPCGADGLLRSAVVREDLAGRGHGAALLQAIEAHARRAGLQTLWLLTTSAADWFAQHGWRTVARSEAPAALQATGEFRTLCPSSAICMCRSLADGG